MLPGSREDNAFSQCPRRKMKCRTEDGEAACGGEYRSQVERW